MNQKGFSLLEIVIVAGIIILLAGGGLYIKYFQDQSSLVKTGADATQNATDAIQQANRQTQTQQNVLNQVNNDKKADKVLTISRRGGDCPGGSCEWELTIYNDGRYSYRTGNETWGTNKELVGVFSESEVTELERQINSADFVAIKSKKFTGTCPVVVDGSETTYTFYTRGEVIASCTYVIDKTSPVFKYIGLLASKVKSVE